MRIVGFHRDATGIHGFVRRREDMTSFDVPGATATYGNGINTQGDIVGYFIDSTGGYHGFLWSRQATDDEQWDHSGRDEHTRDFCDNGKSRNGNHRNCAHDSDD